MVTEIDVLTAHHLSTAQAAAYLKIKENMVRQRVRKGLLHAYTRKCDARRTGRRAYYFLKADLKAYADSLLAARVKAADAIIAKAAPAKPLGNGSDLPLFPSVPEGFARRQNELHAKLERQEAQLDAVAARLDRIEGMLRELAAAWS